MLPKKLLPIILASLLGQCDSKSHVRIIGGDNADLGTYQNVVAMELKLTTNKPFTELHRAHLCTAVVLKPTWTLTAAHCVIQYEMDLIKYSKYKAKGVVRYGSAFGVPYTNESFSDIISALHHPAYFQMLPDKNFKNDIGLLKTCRIELDHYGKLSAADYATLEGLRGTSAGFGLTESEGVIDSALNLHTPLQISEVYINKCPTLLKNLLYPSMCLRGPCNRKASVCSGDSGGPVLHSSGVVGVHSLGFINCYTKEYYLQKYVGVIGVITPVSPYINWISNLINNETYNAKYK